MTALGQIPNKAGTKGRNAPKADGKWSPDENDAC
jgi:hypothetical protein